MLHAIQTRAAGQHHVPPQNLASSRLTLPDDKKASASAAVEAGRRYGIRDGVPGRGPGGSSNTFPPSLLFQATPFHLSVLSAISQLLGTWAQLLSVKASRWFPNRKTQVLYGILGQALSWIPILVLPLLWPEAGPWLLLCGVALYFACTHFTTPAWTTLITDLLNANDRGTYFARRSRAMAVVSFLALTIGGALLALSTQHQLLGIGFAAIFLAAGLCRAASAMALSKLPDLPPHEPGENHTGFLHT